MGDRRFSRRGALLGGLALAGGGLLLRAPAALAVPAPHVIDCAGWGARPNSAIVPVFTERPVKILVHHTASPNVDDTSLDAAVALARGIQNFHMDRRGWLDSGQHFTISRGGHVLEGRRRSLEALRSGRKHVEGAHCTGQNRVSVGIENEGIYLDAAPPQILWDRLREMCAHICAQYGIRPTEIHGHRDFKDTACPGDVLYGELPRLRSEVAAVLGQAVEGVAAALNWPLLRQGDEGTVVRAAQHLLREAGMPGVTADGAFDAATADAVRLFQVTRFTEEVNGMIGGESWPLLARPTRTDDGSEAAQAARVLAGAGRGAEGLPDAVDRPGWLRLLHAATRR